MIKGLPGYGGLYKISSDGYIISQWGRPMKPYINNNGYACIDLEFKGHRYKKLVHRLVAYCFCEGYAEGKVVNHKDANRLNNKYTNLEWVTTTENMQDVLRRGKLDTQTAREALSKKSKRPVIQMDLAGNFIAEYTSVAEASKETGISGGTIIKCYLWKKTPRSKKDYATAGGYRWKLKYPNKKLKTALKIILVKDGISHRFPSVNQASKYLGVNPSTLNAKVKKGITSYKGYSLIY